MDVAQMTAQGEQVRQQREMGRDSTLMGMVPEEPAGSADRYAAPSDVHYEAIVYVTSAPTRCF